MGFLDRASRFYQDREYFRSLVKYAIPIALQSLITSALNFVAVIFIGQLGDTSIAALGLANQIWFLLNVILFGIMSGCAIFLAQLWGKKDIQNIRLVLGLAIKLGVILGLFFWVISIFFPEQILQLYTMDPVVIQAGSQYLRVFGWSYVFFVISTAYGFCLRSTGYVRLPLIISSVALGFNVLISYPFIFGWEALHLPAMGLNGAAIAGVLARILECLAFIIGVYHDRNNPSASSMKDIFTINPRYLLAVFKPVSPVIFNEFLWSMGVTTYNAIFAHISTSAIAAMNIVSTIDQLTFVVFLGIGNATAILVGHQIGRGNRKEAFQYAGRSIGLQITGAFIMGILVFFFARYTLQFFNISSEVIADSQNILKVLALGMLFRYANHVIIIGIIRAGGDTQYSLFLDGFIIWLIGVPLTAAGAFLFHLPIYLVYALTLTEEFVKFILGLRRYLSQKWIKDLTNNVTTYG